MDITVGIICMQLQQYYQIDTNISMEWDITIKGIRIWSGEKPVEQFLYLCREMPWQRRTWSEWKGKLLIGIHCDLPPADSGIFVLSVRETVEFDLLMNTLQEIFEKFYRWNGEMERLFYSQADFTLILNELEQSYGLVAILVDKNLYYIAMSDSYSLRNPWVKGKKTMELDMVNELMTDPYFRRAIEHNKPFIYRALDEDIYSYCYNIKFGGRYEARLLIQDKDMGKFYGGLTFAGYVGERLGKILAYRSDEKIQETELYDFYSILQDLLKGIPKNEEEIRQCLLVRGWRREHVYQAYVFQFISQESESVTRRYYQVEMERLFQECCILPDREYLCCIRNLSLTAPELWDIRQEVAVFLWENLCKAGISQRFEDVARLRQYYLEAERALKIGQNSNSTWWYYPFASLILPYICEQSVQELEAHQLYHPAIRTLLQYDRKEGTELVKSVCVYMKHRYNVTQAAQALFIHRTTLLFRLQRIEILTGLNWESWEDRIHLAVTFELMRRNGEAEWMEDR